MQNAARPSLRSSTIANARKHRRHASIASSAQQVDVGSLLATSQRRLQHAEARHARAIEHAKATLAKLLMSEAESLGTSVGSYTSELDRAAANLANAAAAARDGAEKAKTNGTSHGWGGEDIEARARIRAKADAADREARRLRRQSARAAREGASQAASLLEDAAQKLSRKVGDLSPLLEEAKSVVDKAASRVEPSAPGKPVPIQQMLDAVDTSLSAAKNATQTEVAVSANKFSKNMARAGQNTAKGAADIVAELNSSEQKELLAVRAADTSAPKVKQTGRIRKAATVAMVKSHT